MTWMIAIPMAAGVLTVSATSTRITPATVAPTCGMRSRKPVITASTIGNGNPKAQAETPATTAATSEIARLPISDDETAPIDSSSTGCQRACTSGRAKPNSHSVIVRRSISRNSARKVKVTSESTDPKMPPAIPSSVVAASGSPLARSSSAERTESWVPLETNVSNASLLEISSQYAGISATKSRTWSHSGPTVTTTISATATNSAANTASAAWPRFQPRLTSAPTTGSSPIASTTATKIDSSTSSATITSTTKAPNSPTLSRVRTGTSSSTCREGERSSISSRGSFAARCGSPAVPQTHPRRVMPAHPARSEYRARAPSGARSRPNKEARVSDLVAIAYPDLDTARQVVSNVGEAQKAHLIELDDLVIVERRGDGKVKLHQPSMAGAGAAGGALWGGLIGLIFFVPLFGMALGAASGAAAGALSDSGVDDRFMKDLGEKLEPGGAALIALVRQVNMDKLLAEVKIPGEVLQTSLSNESEEALRNALAAAGR